MSGRGGENVYLFYPLGWAGLRAVRIRWGVSVALFRGHSTIASLKHEGHEVAWWGLGLSTCTPIPACTAERGALRTRRKALAVLCGLRTSVFFVIREAAGGIGRRCLFGIRQAVPWRGPTGGDSFEWFEIGSLENFLTRSHGVRREEGNQEK